MSQIINILIRTSNRPVYFANCIESIKKQTNRNYKIIVGCDNKEDNYFKEYEHIIYDRIEAKAEKDIYVNDTRIKHFPFNLYFNELYKKVKSGYIMFLDDDDYFESENAIEDILNNVSENQALFWKVDCGGRLVPSYDSGRPIERDISMIGICFHSKFIPLLQFDGYKRGDFRIASRIYDLMPVKYLDKVLTATQDEQHSGNRKDKDEKRIIVLVPVWKRPKILKEFIKGLKRIKKVEPIMVSYYFVLSPEDEFFNQNLKIIHSFQTNNILEWKNYPVSEKMNAAIRYINDNEEYDFLMNIGSDDILNPDVWQIYKPYLNYKYFGVNRFFCYDGKECLEFNYHHIVGGARMIHSSIIRRLLAWDDVYPESNSGLDSLSHSKIERFAKAYEVDCEPLVLDLKSSTNINTMTFLRGTDLTKQVDFNDIQKYFYEIS